MWISIDTAPKDGTRILAWDGETTFVTYWIEPDGEWTPFSDGSDNSMFVGSFGGWAIDDPAGGQPFIGSKPLKWATIPSLEDA